MCSFERSALVAVLVCLVVGVYGAPAGEADADSGAAVAAAAYRWCVPEELQANCSRLVRAAGVSIGCVAGLDRLDCLRRVRNREADYLMADPEDLYVAAHLENEDFQVFGEQRSQEEPTAPFRYEGIMLVRAADGFRSLADLRGKKSCHTGFGRNVGYKIPVARLQRAGLLKLPPSDDTLSLVERELSALSELFSASCLPGSYSPHADTDQLLKRRYANLCARCASPERCDGQDRYGGYDGAIRCLVENGGDVAFTKTIFVRRYFGLPVTPGGLAKPALNPAARPQDYAYLCEDGTTRPIATDTPACSWAQRPWPVLLANGDLGGARTAELQGLAQRLHRYFTDPASEASAADRAAALPLRLNPVTPLVARQQLSSARAYLQQANYLEVIERAGPYGDRPIRLCVTSEPARLKCEALRQAAFSRDIRPAFGCLLRTEQACIEAVRAGQQADAVVLTKPAPHLKPVVLALTQAADQQLSADVLLKRNDAPDAVYVRSDLDEAVLDGVVHAFTALSEAFAPGKAGAQIFRLFGPFRVQENGPPVGNLIFRDAGRLLVAPATQNAPHAR